MLDGVSNWAESTVDGATATQLINDMNEYESFDGILTPHDDDGNLESDGAFVFSWDAFNSLAEVQETGGTIVAEYSYDALGRRIAKTASTDRQRPGRDRGSCGLCRLRVCSNKAVHAA